MTGDWERLQQLFERLVALPSEQRGAHALCSEADAAVRQRALALAAADAAAGDPIEPQLRRTWRALASRRGRIH